MNIQSIKTSSYQDQCPGTSGLRKKTRVFLDNCYYLENYIQSCLVVCDVDKTKPVILGGDGRFYNDIAISQTIKVLLGNGFRHILVCKNGILSTPACSHLIRIKGASLGFIFSASHNPGGMNGDVGIKLNLSDGAPAPVEITNAIYKYSQQISSFLLADVADILLERIQQIKISEAVVSIIDGVLDYVDLMKDIFSFDLIKTYLKSHSVLFDAMHAVTGPYAKKILIDELGADYSSVIHDLPLPDFAQKHPDPNPINANELYQLAFSNHCPYSLLGASDGDGDRNMVLGQGVYINPCDSLAIILEYAHLLPYFQKISGVARSMPTSRAVDLVAKDKGILCYVTPTGWKFFSNLLNDNRIQLCGEESFGISSSHIREKDGLWAFLCWLNILAATQKTPKELIGSFFKKYGRHYYVRYDFENLDLDVASQLMENLYQKPFHSINFLGQVATEAGAFSYIDPIDQKAAKYQGYQMIFSDKARFIVRLSGTGTSGATLRLYLEVYDRDYLKDLEKVLAPLVDIAINFTEMKTRCNREIPDYII